MTTVQRTTIGRTLPFIDEVRAGLIRELLVTADDNTRVLRAFEVDAHATSAGLRALAVSEAWSSPAQRSLAVEAGLLADAVELVADAAALAHENYGVASAALTVELEGILAA